jgi:hypothetical protein
LGPEILLDAWQDAMLARTVGLLAGKCLMLAQQLGEHRTT